MLSVLEVGGCMPHRNHMEGTPGSELTRYVEGREREQERGEERHTRAFIGVGWRVHCCA